MLPLGPPDRANERPIRRELLEQRLRDRSLGRRGHGYAVERRPVGCAEGAVARTDLDVGAAELVEERLRLVGERDVPLDRDELAAEQRQHRRRVSRATT